jgi:hypothetical protein
MLGRRYSGFPQQALPGRHPDNHYFPNVSPTPSKIGLPKLSMEAGLTWVCRCWDGKNVDSPDHKSHVAYPSSGTFESTGPCPATHPVRLPQLMYEVMWDTREFNDPSIWPDSGQPLVYSMGDA